MGKNGYLYDAPERGFSFPKKKKPWYNRWWFFVIVFFAISFFLRKYLPEEYASTTRHTQTTRSLSTGDRGVLYHESGTVIVASEKKYLDEFFNALNIKDKYGVGEMVLTGKIFEVPNYTDVLIIDSGLFNSKVRVLEGKHAGRSGWVPYEWVH